ncbi:J domain-containing protein required for chloroplast accumulation response 1-like isoform X2 [Quercus lobata]|uniref:J domain-containing protein required for chloroplast accumulation response 1-like isoform X2 n=1 Tax=Quercus lobata TaxID=97700 RepID=UPI0012479320|nr:J domain-containing protein required for chloroplast accumulation response 1-like isoform X2 [Quercus lobata]XP_030973061.1 J domain-containing protein required for chloroplast accumulation response 1-like isoform X2 [Quercus lobata]
MERFSQRESVLLGYSPQRAFTNSNSSPDKNSDLDFNDVFGGPPRRSSIQEKRYNFNEAKDTYGRSGEDESHSCRISWPCHGEKPVFGEENLNRRRYPSEDFFNDIFRGDESLTSTPRKRDSDVFSSAPDSRVLSPARPLPPKAEPFGSSSLPSQFSLPAKLTKGMDLPVYGSTPLSPSKCKDGASNGISSSSFLSSNLSRFSSQSTQSQEELKNGIQSSYSQSLLSQEIILNNEESSNLIKSDKKDTEGNIKKDSKISEAPTDSSQFHFSIYKWACKGVPLMIPFRGSSSRLKEPVKMKRSLSLNGRIEIESKVRESPLKSYKIEHNKEENDSVLDTSAQDGVEPCQNVAEPILLTTELETLSSLHSVVEDVSADTMMRDIREEIKHQSLSKIDLCDNDVKEITILTKEVHKPELKPLRSLLFDNDYEQGNERITQRGKGKESTIKSAKNPLALVDESKNVKKQDGKRTTLNDVEVDKASLQDSPVYSGGNLGRNRVKGKVKEFVKMFNQEAPPKPNDNIDSRSQSSRWKKKGSYGARNEVSVSSTKTGLEVKIPRVHVSNTVPEASIKADEHLKELEREHSSIKTTNNIFSDASSQLKDNSSASTASIPNGSMATVEDTDDSFPGNFLVIDAKIRQWSNGKKGNIRSLLSNLQYVLWPESGWKPVPLVDIIEGTSVKRAYQKALLCLHPDKLQQKGAASHQKYIAEKVFEILQEAWTHFNSLGSL